MLDAPWPRLTKRRQNIIAQATRYRAPAQIGPPAATAQFNRGAGGWIAGSGAATSRQIRSRVVLQQLDPPRSPSAEPPGSFGRPHAPASRFSYNQIRRPVSFEGRSAAWTYIG